MENRMNKEEAIRRIDELATTYARCCFGDDAESIVSDLKKGGKSHNSDESAISTAVGTLKDVSDDPVRNYYIAKYIEFWLWYNEYEGALYNEGLL